MCLSIRAIFIDFMIALSRQPVWEADYAGCSSEDAASVPGNQETGDRRQEFRSSGVAEWPTESRFPGNLGRRSSRSGNNTALFMIDSERGAPKLI
jgi:hypothetical protein